MILTHNAILSEINKGTIKIEPFNIKNLGTNSYDIHLGKYLSDYVDTVLDAKKHNTINTWEIQDEGFVLQPNTLYLGATLEYTETMAHIPNIDGKSSVGRLGISIHITAGKGDIGFKNHWTLEIFVMQPVRVYAGMPIGQLTYQVPHGEIDNLYSEKENAKYTEKSDRPQESMMWKNKF
jgi:dCTP deaminase